MNLMVTLGPGLAPIVGGVLVSSLGWRSILVGLSGLGCALLALTWWLLPETREPSRDFDAAALARNYALLLRSRTFLCLAVGGGCATTSMYAFIASAPFIFAGELHRPPGEVGYYLSILIGGVWLGSALAGRLIARWPLKTVLVGANLVSVAAAVVLLATTLAGIRSVPLVVAAMALFTLGAGIASPAALTLAVSVNPNVIGSASGLYGFSQMAVGAASTALAGFGGDPLLAAALVLAGAGLVAQVSFWWALRRS
jgi:DHA1 family bicyclomycin/chloramphenicol resistance-like MFS transporter